MPAKAAYVVMARVPGETWRDASLFVQMQAALAEADRLFLEGHEVVVAVDSLERTAPWAWIHTRKAVPGTHRVP